MLNMDKHSWTKMLMYLFLFGTTFSSVLSASLSKEFQYQTPDECQWLSVNSDLKEEEATVDDKDMALVCHLDAINNEMKNFNFTMIQPQHTVRLRLECDSNLFLASSLNSSSFRSLVELQDLSIEYCKIENLTAGAFQKLKELRNLTLRTHHSDRSSMKLIVHPDAFSKDLDLLQILDLSTNNIFSLPEGIFCPLHHLEILNLTRNNIRNITVLKFKEQIQKCGENLITLDLSYNSIDLLPPEILSGLKSLKNLFLNNNEMSFFADRALEGLISLTILQLNDNKLMNLPSEIFSDKKNLKELYLRNNSLNVLAPGLFKDLTRLLILDLSKNKLTSEWINSATFTGLLHLTVLDISENLISRLEPFLFRDLYQLKILRLEGNFIKTIHENAFSSLYNLHTLILSNNRLSVIENYTFSGLNALSLLCLDNNDIELIDPEALKSSFSLQDLYLDNNKLLEVPQGLSNMPLLKILDLGGNYINNVANSAFNQMLLLDGLRLAENNIGNISKGTFDKMPSLKMLDLSRNKIQNVEPGAFNKNVNLQGIRLDSNYLSDMSDLFDTLSNLIWLNISHNKLEWFDYAVIPQSLQWLDIQANQIPKLGNYFKIENTLQLKILDASSNKLTEIKGNVIPSSIEYLKLSDNLISNIEPYTFYNKPNLSQVSLQGNKITHLNPYSLRVSKVPPDKRLPEFYIGHNPYECDCTMDWLQKSNPKNRTRNQPKLMDFEAIYCRLLYSRGLSYFTLVEVKSSEFLCKYYFRCDLSCHCCDLDECDCKMTCPSNCMCYHDQSWSTNVVDCTESGYMNVLPEGIPMSATELYLDGNDFQAIESRVFIGCKKLKILYLNSSKIEEIYNWAFKDLKELELLRLDNNKLQELYGQQFEGLENLRELYLQNNKICDLKNDTFLPLRHLQILRLDNNKIKYFAVWNLPPFLESVSLANNLWSCECKFANLFYEWIKVSRKIVIDLPSVRCVTQINRMEEELDVFSINHNSTLCEVVPNDGLFILPVIESTINMTKEQKQITVGQFIQDYMTLLLGTVASCFIAIVVILLVYLCKKKIECGFLR